ARPGDLLASLLRGPDGAAGSARGPLLARPARRRRDDRLRRLVGERAARVRADAAALAGRRGLRARLRSRGGRLGGARDAAAALLDDALLARLLGDARLRRVRDHAPRAGRPAAAAA